MDNPNLIFILTDDQGHWAMGCAGNSEIRTPNLDRLAATGSRFENFFCASPVCSPARASILTGRIPSQHGIQDFLRAGNSNIYGADDQAIEYLAGQTAYTDILSERGYTCGLSGKWHLGYSEKPQKGFVFWDVHASGAGPYYRAPMIREGKAYQTSDYVSDLITDNALGFLEMQRSADQPFCLNIHYTAPHAPWGREHHPPEFFEDYYQNCPFESTPDEPMHPQQLSKKGSSGSLGFTEETRRETLSGYFAAMTAMDANVGRVLDWLEDKGLREQTLVVFTSDNGMNMGHHGIYGKGNGTFPPNMFDTSVKVPMIVSHPGRVSEGAVIASLHSHYDIMPTLLDYLDVETPDEVYNGDDSTELAEVRRLSDSLSGRSFSVLLEGRALDGDDRVVVFDEYGPTRMIRTAAWKYIHRYPFGPCELYDLVNDPNEQKNLIHEKKYQSVREWLQGDLETWFARYADPKRDGSREAVMGRGQLDVVGPRARGRKRFGDDVIFARDAVNGGR